MEVESEDLETNLKLIDTALERLETLLSDIETFMKTRAENDKYVDLEKRAMYVVDEDRFGWPSELKEEQAKVARLKEVNRSVSERLSSAMQSVKEILDVHGY